MELLELLLHMSSLHSQPGPYVAAQISWRSAEDLENLLLSAVAWVAWSTFA